LATLALKSTCILNLKPSNYLYLQRNGKIDFCHSDAAGCGSQRWLVSSGDGQSPPGCDGRPGMAKGDLPLLAVPRDGQNGPSPLQSASPGSEHSAKKAKLTARSFPCTFPCDTCLPPTYACRWHSEGSTPLLASSPHPPPPPPPPGEKPSPGE